MLIFRTFHVNANFLFCQYSCGLTIYLWKTTIRWKICSFIQIYDAQNSQAWLASSFIWGKCTYWTLFSFIILHFRKVDVSILQWILPTYSYNEWMYFIHFIISLNFYSIATLQQNVLFIIIIWMAKGMNTFFQGLFNFILISKFMSSQLFTLCKNVPRLFLFTSLYAQYFS